MILRADPNQKLPEQIFRKYPEIKKLDETQDHRFFLTGSWAFGCSWGGSDVDLYAQYSSEIEEFLDRKSFDNMGRINNYGDPLLITLYLDTLVHVQLVDPIEMKHKIQLTLEGLPPLIKETVCGRYSFSKTQKRTIWSMLHHIFSESPHVSGTFVVNAPTIKDNPHTCALCGSCGLDMGFTFYCTNKSCKNFHP